MADVTIAITEASYSGNKGAAAMLQSSIQQLHDVYGEELIINLMSVYPADDRKQVPFDYVRVISAKPELVLFIAFPCAVLYRLFRWIPFIKKLLLKQKILKAYSQTDLVINEAGVSMVDSRGFIMNVYSFVCSAIPMLLDVSVIKYSQALGTFNKFYNRILAKWQLPKFKKIIARGEITRKNLSSIGIEENVEVCADGAFTMQDNPDMAEFVDNIWKNESFFQKTVVGLSISNVVYHKCQKLGIDYIQSIVGFIDELNRKGYNVLIIANAARINSKKTRTNDLMLGDAIYNLCTNFDMVRWYHKEMTAEELREHIGRCQFLIASRFHSMIAGLERGVPVMLVGWSHKYKEVLDQFELGEYAVDYSSLNEEVLLEKFQKLINDECLIRKKIASHIEEVRKSSFKNIKIICDELNQIVECKKSEKQESRRTPAYIRKNCVGNYVAIRKGYALKEEYRINAASGGLITALLCNMLKHGDIDGAWVVKSIFNENGRVTYKTWIATTEKEICDAGSSVYMNVPILKHLNLIKEFHGKVAVVMQPCMLQAFCTILEREPELNNKIVLKIGLFCSGSCNYEATALALSKARIITKDAKRLYYRLGWWRGPTVIEYEDGHRKSFSYTKYFCAFKNAYFFSKKNCFHCQDHFARNADISFGDVWLKEMKKEKIKHTGCVIRNENALKLLQRAQQESYIFLKHMGEKDLIRSQKRALVFKYCVCPTDERKKWNYKLAFYLANRNRLFSEQHHVFFEFCPQTLFLFYMCFIRWLMNF